MTHVILQEPESPSEKSIMCVERDSQTAIILQGDFDRLDELVRIAGSMKAPKVYLIADQASLPAFIEDGWVVSEKILVEKKAGK
jgi:hypothetical protein